MAALEAGKNVYNEKPLAVEREEARKVLELAAEKEFASDVRPTLSLVRLADLSALIDCGSDRHSCRRDRVHDFTRPRRLAP